MKDRKPRDRKYSQRNYRLFQMRKRIVVALLGGQCRVCKTREAPRGFHLHHISYHETESNYPRHSKSMSVREKRLAEAEAHPERFRLLCGKCHRLIETIRRLDHDEIIFLLSVE